MNLNQIVISGRIGADPELRYTQNKLPVLNFSIAQNEGKKDLEQKPMWFDIVVFDHLANHLHPILKKSDEVVVIGKVKIHSYQDKSGIERKKIQITAYNIRLLTYKRYDESMTQVTQNQETMDAPF